MGELETIAEHQRNKGRGQDAPSPRSYSRVPLALVAFAFRHSFKIKAIQEAVRFVEPILAGCLRLVSGR